MDVSTYRFAAGSLVLPVLVGCASLDPKPDYERASQLVESTIGVDELYRPGEDTEIEQRVEALLAEGLTAEEAVQICLLNNPRIQAELLRIGVSRADFVQSGLFSNPTFSFSPRWPDGGGLSNLQFGVAQNIAELWQLPYRKRAAQRDLDQAVLAVAREASLTAQRSRMAYYRVLHVVRAGEIAEENLGLMEQLVDLAAGRSEAGAGSEVDVSLASAQHADAKLRVQSAILAETQEWAEFGKLLGLRVWPAEVSMTDVLSEPIDFSVTPEDLIAAAGRARLDWQAAQMAVDAAADRIAYERWRIFGVLELGISAERSPQWDKTRGGGWAVNRSLDLSDGSLARSTSLGFEPAEPERSEWVVGPSISGDLPIFDQNQAQIARADFLHRQAAKLLDAIQRDVLHDAHVASQRLQTAAESVRLFREELIPLRQRVLTLSEDGYRAGRSTFLIVVQSQQALQDARAGYVAALRDYATAMVEVEQVAGCPFSGIVQPTVEPPSNHRTLYESEPGHPTSMPAEISP